MEQKFSELIREKDEQIAGLMEEGIILYVAFCLKLVWYVVVVVVVVVVVEVFVCSN